MSRINGEGNYSNETSEIHGKIPSVKMNNIVTLRLPVGRLKFVATGLRKLRYGSPFRYNLTPVLFAGPTGVSEVLLK